jgi:hypothetical protein
VSSSFSLKPNFSAVSFIVSLPRLLLILAKTVLQEKRSAVRTVAFSQGMSPSLPRSVVESGSRYGSGVSVGSSRSYLPLSRPDAAVTTLKVEPGG